MAEGEATRRVALLRGVNVGGVKVLMEPLKNLAETLGWREVQTYIASGNLVFSAVGGNDELAERLRGAMKDEMGVYTPVRCGAAVGAGRASLEAGEGQPEPCVFLLGVSEIDRDLYESLKTADEELRVVDGHVHFFAPGGIGKSKLAEKLGKVVHGTEMTGRNLNTVRKLVEMSEG